MTAPAGHVTVAAVPKLLPVPHAVDSSDDEREREAVAETDGVERPAREADGEALTDGEPPAARDGDAERETERDGERDVDMDGEELRLFVGDSPAWHCT